MKQVRYSRGFKIKVVQEAEEEGKYPNWVSKKYGVAISTMMEWVRRYGSGKYGKIIRVERPEDRDELERLKRELKTFKMALADAHVSLAVERAYVELACEEMGQKPEVWRKKQAGRPRTAPLRRNRS